MNNTTFKPVRGLEENILKEPIRDGYVYFATDTGKIYIDKGTTRSSIGGGTGVSVYYAHATEVEIIDEAYYQILKTFLDNTIDYPKVNDLIINIDGDKSAFYKVVKENLDGFLCDRLAVSGSGGGGGGGIAKKIKIIIDPLPTSNLINGQEASISFTVTSGFDEEGTQLDDKVNVDWEMAEVIGDNQFITYRTGTLDVVAGKKSSFQFGTSLRESTSTKITFTPRGINSGVGYSKQIVVVASQLELKNDPTFSVFNLYESDKLSLKCTAIGNMDKILDFYFDKELIHSKELRPTDLNDYEIAVPIEKATHGHHLVRIELHQAINHQRVMDAGTPPIEYEIAVKEFNNNTPIIWLGNYKETYYNYDSIQIPYLVYDPQDSNKATVHLYRNGIEIDSSPRTIDTTILNQYNIFEIVDAEMDRNNVYSISCGEEDRKTTRVIEFSVVEDPNRQMEVVRKNALLVNLNAKGRSNDESETQREIWGWNQKIGNQQVGEEEKTEYKQAVFKNFNWYNNGWLRDKNRNSFLRISNGASLELPVGPLTYGAKEDNKKSNTIEIQFKVRNIQKYSNLIKNITRYLTRDKETNAIIKDDANLYKAFLAQSKYDNYDAFLREYLPHKADPEIPGDEDDLRDVDELEFAFVQKNLDLKQAICKYVSTSDNSDNGITSTVGFCLGPQDAFFSNGTNTVNVAYVEDELINITMVYDGNATSNKLMSIYINGVLTGVITSTVSGSFTINSPSIIFNSDECDIDLYSFRIYNTALTVSDIVTNYSVDRKNVKIYDQNKLAIENANIQEFQLNYDSVMQYNREHPEDPLMSYIIYDTSKTENDKLSWAKTVDVNIGVTFVNTGLDRAYESGELEQLAIQDGLCLPGDPQEKKQAAIKLYYKHHCPSWTGENIKMNVQGTSSQFYPRRNYKLKTKGKVKITTPEGTKEKKVYNILLNRGPYADDYLKDQKDLVEGTIQPGEESTRQKKWYMNNYTNGTDRWTMKVDYMESSGTYNAGMANLVHNAYSKHPLQDYIKEGSLVNPNLLKSSVFENQDIRWNDYRTSIQGFPVMAFQKRKNDIIFIGFYRMLLDKHSDEHFGFDVDEAIYNKYCNPITKCIYEPKTYYTEAHGIYTLCTDDFKDFNNEQTYYQLVSGPEEEPRYEEISMYKTIEHPSLSETTECWEFSNNSRTFCSFRDPLGRKELQFDVYTEEPDGQKKRALNSEKCGPVVGDIVEYRYHRNEDALDYIYSVKNESDKLEDAQELYPGVDFSNIDAKCDILLDNYKNWEKATAWVWSTCTDAVKSEGKYEPVLEIGDEVYTTDKYYLRQGDGYIKTSELFNKEHEYFKKVPDDPSSSKPTMIYVKANVVSSEKYLYAPNKYYIIRDSQYILETASSYNPSLDYFNLTISSDEELELICDRLVIPATGEWSGEKQYYTYNKNARITEGEKAVKKVSISKEEYDPTASLKNGVKTSNKYYEPTTIYGHKFDSKEYRGEKFRRELTNHFDPEYLATYFVITEVFQCYDSRGKNAMMASWGPQKPGGDYIWYPCFYDMDTQLGINNTGIPSFEFNVDATLAGNFSTSDSVLWNNFYTYFKDSYITQKYRHLKGVTAGVPWEPLKIPFLSSVDTIEKWYTADPVATNNLAARGDRPLIAVNLDEYYKYISIANTASKDLTSTGALDDSGNYVTKGDTFFYALQGDRSQSRRQFLTNRIEYIDSWLNEGNYTRAGANRIAGRIAANNPGVPDKEHSDQPAIDAKTSDIWVETPGHPYFLDPEETKKANEFDAEFWMNLTPIRSSYVTLGDDNEAYPSQKYDGITPVHFKVPSIESGVRGSLNYPEQLFYVYGINQIADLGDMSNMYWQEFKIEGDASKLTTLKLGNDVLDSKGRKWFNRKVNEPSIPAGKPINEEQSKGMPLLKEVNLSNITVNTGGGASSPVLDFTSCEKLHNFRATGSNFEEFKFAPGVALDTLYLPKTITRLELAEANLLKNLITKYKDLRKGDIVPHGLYMEGMFQEVPEFNLKYLSLIGGALGYDSYKLLDKFYSVKNKESGHYNVSMTKVDWSPYRRLVEGDIYDIGHSEEYMKDDFHYHLVPYEFTTQEQFIKDIFSGVIFRKKPDCLNWENNITSLKLLSDLAKSSKFHGLTDDSPVRLTGTVYINNSPEAPIEEYIIRDLQKVYPELEVYCAYVTKGYTARFILIDDVTGAELYVNRADGIPGKSIQRVSAKEFQSKKIFDNPYRWEKGDPEREFKGYVAEKDSYDFHGWSIANDASEDHLIKKANWDSSPHAQIKEGIYDYTFYAVFTIHKWKMNFINSLDPEYSASLEIEHGQPLSDDVPMPIDSNEKAFDRRYAFRGWTLNENKDGEYEEHIPLDNVLYSFKKGVAVEDMTFYAVFQDESVYDTILDKKYLKFIAQDYKDISTQYEDGGAGTSEWSTGKYNQKNESGYYISLNPSYSQNLSGKITLPTRTPEGVEGIIANRPIYGIALNGFSDASTHNKITHIFFDKKSSNEYRIISQRAFQDLRTLKYIDFLSMKSLRVVDNDAFKNDILLGSIDLIHNIYYIGQNAFASAGYKAKPFEVRLGHTLTEIKDGAVSYGNYSSLVIGSPSAGSHLQQRSWNKGRAVFSFLNASYLGEYPPSTMTIYCPQSKADIFNGWIQDDNLIAFVDSKPALSLNFVPER